MEKNIKEACYAAITAFASIAGEQPGKDKARCIDACEGGCYDKVQCTGDITNAAALGGGVAGGFTA